jgi:hypothetical protein
MIYKYSIWETTKECFFKRKAFPAGSRIVIKTKPTAHSGLVNIQISHDSKVKEIPNIKSKVITKVANLISLDDCPDIFYVRNSKGGFLTDLDYDDYQRAQHIKFHNCSREEANYYTTVNLAARSIAIFITRYQKHSDEYYIESQNVKTKELTRIPISNQWFEIMNGSCGIRKILMKPKSNPTLASFSRAILSLPISITSEHKNILYVQNDIALKYFVKNNISADEIHLHGNICFCDDTAKTLLTLNFTESIVL